MRVLLTVIEGPQKGKRFDFSDPDTFLLGRDNTGSNAHFRLNNDDTQVSRNHFLLEINPPDCFIRDAGSLNGTFIVSSKKASGFGKGICRGIGWLIGAIPVFRATIMAR